MVGLGRTENTPGASPNRIKQKVKVKIWLILVKFGNNPNWTQRGLFSVLAVLAFELAEAPLLFLFLIGLLTINRLVFLIMAGLSLKYKSKTINIKACIY